MTKKRSRILSILLAVALLMSAFPVVLPAMTAAAEEEAQSYLASPDPGVSVTCSETTWISAGEGSGSPGSAIVAATPSGIVAKAGNSYYGETASMTAITARFINEPSTVPQISCTSGGKNVVFTTPAVTDYGETGKQYVWTIVNGTATGDILEFSITYPFNDKNYVNKAYSYVREAAQPSGIYIGRTAKTCDGLASIDLSDPLAAYLALQGLNMDEIQNYLRDSKKYALDFTSVFLGNNTFYSVPTFTENDWELCRMSYNIGSKGIGRTTDENYHLVGSFKNLTSAGTSITHGFATNDYVVPRADVYVDTSVTSNLSQLNLKVATNNIVSGLIGDYGLNKGAQQISVDCGGLSSSSSGNAYFPWNGYVQLQGGGWVDSQSERIDYITQSGVPADGSSYTITTQSLCFAENSSIKILVGGQIGVTIHTFDKGDLRDTVNNILAGTLYENDNDPTNVFNCMNKGVNPQQWQFKNGWRDYNLAMRDAMGVLLNPRTTQDQINAACTALVNAYDALQFKKADYSVYNEYKDLADEAIAQETSFYQQYGEHWFYEADYAALTDALDAVNESCHILYQPQVDLWTDALIAAYDALRVLPADYTSLNAAVERANGYLSQTLDDGSSIYVNTTDLATAVAAVRYDLTKADQDTIAQYEKNINDAIASLTLRPADYTQINILKAEADSLKRSNYTNYNTVIAVLKNVNKHSNLKITQQDIVDADAAALRAAIDGLIPKGADLTELEALLARAAALNSAYYQNEGADSYAEVLRVVNKINNSNYSTFDIFQQSKIDGYVSELDAALDALVMDSADFTAVDAAIANWQNMSDSYKRDNMTAESISAVDTIIESIINDKPYYKADRQNEVDGWAQRINNAINNVQFKTADYTRVEAAIQRANALDETYYADFSGVQNAINSVNWNLIPAEQATVDAYANAIYDAIDQLVPGPADYSRVNASIARFEALNKNYYTRQSVQAVEEVINSVNWDLNKERQADVVTYAYEINEAILNLVEADADYTLLRRAIVSIPSDLDIYYTQESIDVLNSAVNSVDWTLKARNQATVDGYVEAINQAVNDLEYLPGDYSEVDAAIATGRQMIRDGVLQTNGDYYEVSAQSAADFEAFVAGIDRSYNIIQTAEIHALAEAVVAKYASFTFAESINHARISVTTDKNITYPGDVVTVTVSMKTDYPAAASAIPVLYNSAYYDIVGSGSAAYTFGDNAYINGSTVGGNTNSPDKGYPASYSSSDKAAWNYAYITVAPSSDKGGEAVTLDPELVIASFRLKVKETLTVGNDPLSSRIWVDSAFLKTADNKGGKLYVGRYTTGNVDTNIIPFGQTVDVAGATNTVMIYDENAPAIFTALNAALARQTAFDTSFYTDESYEVYADALAAGQAIVANAANYTIKEQAAVDAAVADIDAAFDALVLKDSDTSALEAALLLTPQYTENEYTEASYLAYTNAVAAAQSILAEGGLTIADNERINAAAQAIVDAIDGLTLKDCSYLDDLFVISEIFPMFDDEEEYDAAALDAYYEAYDACDAFLNEDKTILDDDEALGLINSFYSAYVALEKSALSKTIDNCSLEYDPSCYTQASYGAYVLAYNAAADLLLSIATKDDIAPIQDCVQTLKTRYAALEINPFEYEDEVWAALDLFPQDEDHTVAESLDAYYEAYDALDLFASEKSGSWTALDNEEAHELINALVYAYENLVIEGADVSNLLIALNNAPEYDSQMYTTESYSAYAQAVEAGRALTGVTYDRQDDVDTATQAIIDAFEALELKPFSKLNDVNEALEAQPTLAQNKYIADYWTAYAQARADLEAIVAGADSLTVVDDQDAVEKIAVFNAALADLEELGIIPEFVINSDAVTIENGFVFGLEDIASEDDLTAIFGSIGNVDVVVTPVENGYGTGTVISLVNKTTSEVVDSLTVVISGDANGDGFVDSFDVAIITELVNNFEDPADDATMLALDVFADGWLDSIDLAYVLYMANYELS
ncbi:MAG: hypothetical protein IJU39_03130 [Clostridia bacterium]|nr:hypothetical protein [Clostridia bacterium]